MEEVNGYCVDVIGFNETERLLLQSIFTLAARRDPAFIQRDPNSDRAVDLYLVDADDDGAFNEFKAVHSRYRAPAVLVGTADRGTKMPVVGRPMQWARLLQCFDDVLSEEKPILSTSRPPQAAADLAKSSSAMRRTQTNVPGATRTPRPAPAARAKAFSDSVLVVDDNATVRKFMEAKLAPFGFSTDFAETGEEAVGLTGTKEYTCVFLDVVLPGIDGYQVCKLIKSNKQAVKRTAVVMLTSRSSPFDKLRGSLAGCDEYLTKPVDENQLLEVVAKFLPGSRVAA
jgi:two-component system cell cycle response regulator